MSLENFGERYIPGADSFKDKIVRIPEPIMSKGFRKEKSRGNNNIGIILIALIFVVSVALVFLLNGIGRFIWPVIIFFVLTWIVRLTALKETSRRRQIKEMAIDDYKIPSGKLWSITSVDENGIATYQGGSHGFGFKLSPGSVLGKTYRQLFEGRDLETALLNELHTRFEKIQVVKVDLTREAGRSKSLDTIRASAENAEIPALRSLMGSFSQAVEDKATMQRIVEVQFFVIVPKATKEEILQVMHDLYDVTSSYISSSDRDFYSGIKFLSNAEQIGETLSLLYGTADSFDYGSATFDATRRDEVVMTPTAIRYKSGKKFRIVIEKDEIKQLEPVQEES